MQAQWLVLVAVNQERTAAKGGTVVGEFNATDPEGRELIYMLTNGAGEINNPMFSMEVNGTLRTAEVLDYESNAFLSTQFSSLFIPLKCGL